MFNFYLLRGKVEAVIYAIVITLLLVLINSLEVGAQVRISAGGGIVAPKSGVKVNGIMNVGYDIGKFSAAFDLRSAYGQNQAFIGLQAGYIKGLSKIEYIRPYGGYWKRLTGKTAAQDTYLKEGITYILSTTAPEDLNGHNWGVGVQYVRKYLWFDIAYISQFQAAMGVTLRLW